MLRRLFQVLLILLVLPWGAFSAMPAAAEPVVFAGHQTTARDASHVVSAPKPCRIAILPCGLDVALPVAFAIPPMAQGGTVFQLSRSIIGQGIVPSPSRGPPRVV
ncbi:hypothetical protein EOK75_14175 (plasmid) [Pseudorhodobacter turbinis]|uniref:Uncharacterized protein n=1 Tax=Pseudorhodobacter turbinis TaxID=2500533 RepID=A0A4V1E154_9RHOB|nr:hypothetical protein [Pseudorhodobacter turbinis]QCO56944.1 hypothetical protein EOK75_14175 [Pseudorhodobacter turbinis]